MNKYIPAAAHSGGYGIDFSQPSEDVNAGVSFVAKKLLEHGVTSFCPTLVTSPPSVYHKVPPALNQHQEPQELLLLLLFCSPMVSDFVQDSVFCQCEISDVVFVVVCVCVFSLRFSLRFESTVEELMELEFWVKLSVHEPRS